MESGPFVDPAGAQLRHAARMARLQQIQAPPPAPAVPPTDFARMLTGSMGGMGGWAGGSAVAARLLGAVPHPAAKIASIAIPVVTSALGAGMATQAVDAAAPSLHDSINKGLQSAGPVAVPAALGLGALALLRRGRGPRIVPTPLGGPVPVGQPFGPPLPPSFIRPGGPVPVNQPYGPWPIGATSPLPLHPSSPTIKPPPVYGPFPAPFGGSGPGSLRQVAFGSGDSPITPSAPAIARGWSSLPADVSLPNTPHSPVAAPQNIMMTDVIRPRVGGGAPLSLPMGPIIGRGPMPVGRPGRQVPAVPTPVVPPMATAIRPLGLPQLTAELPPRGFEQLPNVNAIPDAPLGGLLKKKVAGFAEPAVSVTPPTMRLTKLNPAEPELRIGEIHSLLKEHGPDGAIAKFNELAKSQRVQPLTEAELGYIEVAAEKMARQPNQQNRARQAALHPPKPKVVDPAAAQTQAPPVLDDDIDLTPVPTKFAGPRQELYEKMATSLERQLKLETDPAKRLRAAKTMLRGERPELKAALREHLAKIAPDVHERLPVPKGAAVPPVAPVVAPEPEIAAPVVERPAAAPPSPIIEPTPPPAAAAVAKPVIADPAAHVLAAMDKFSDADKGALVSARELREATGLDKPTFDKAVFQLAKDKKVMPHKHDFATSLPPDELGQLVDSSIGDASRETMHANDGRYWVGVAKSKPETPPTASMPEVGSMVPLTKPGVDGPVNIAGRVEKVLPDGRVEVRTQADGIVTVAPSELKHREGSVAAFAEAPKKVPPAKIEKLTLKRPGGSTGSSPLPWQMTRQEHAIGGSPEAILRKGVEHRNAVAQAVAEGKAVPAEVLADYPQFAQARHQNASAAGLEAAIVAAPTPFKKAFAAEAFLKTVPSADRQGVVDHLRKLDPAAYQQLRDLHSNAFLDVKFEAGDIVPPVLRPPGSKPFELKSFDITAPRADSTNKGLSSTIAEVRPPAKPATSVSKPDVPATTPTIITPKEAGFPFDLETARAGMEKRGYAAYGDVNTRAVPHPAGGFGVEVQTKHPTQPGAVRDSLPQSYPTIEEAQNAAIDELAKRTSGSQPPKPAVKESPEAGVPKPPTAGDLLQQAAPYRQYGENYRRNIADSAARLDSLIERGHSPSMIQHAADELKMRLEVHGSPAITATVKPAAPPAAAVAKTYKRETPSATENAAARAERDARLEHLNNTARDMEKKYSEVTSKLNSIPRSHTNKRREWVAKEEHFRKEADKLRSERDALNRERNLELIEDQLESPKSHEHYLKSMSELHEMKRRQFNELLTDREKRRDLGFRGVEDVTKKIEHHQNEADKHTLELIDAIKSKVPTDKLNADEIQSVAEDVHRDFSHRSELGRSVEEAVARRLEHRKQYGQTDIDKLTHLDEGLKNEFRGQLNNASVRGPDWHAKSNEILDRARGENDKLAKAAAEKSKKAAEEAARQAAIAEAESYKENRAGNRAKLSEPRYLEDAERRAKELKGTVEKIPQKGAIDDTTERMLERETINPTWHIEKWLEKDDKGKMGNWFRLKHTPSGLSAVTAKTAKDAKQFLVMAQDQGIDLSGYKDGNSIPSEVAKKLGRVNKAWANNDLQHLDESERAAATGKMMRLSPSLKADMVLGADDLGYGHENKTHIKSAKANGIIKQLAEEVPEFAYNPVFTATDKGTLVFRDGYTFEFPMENFNVHPSELKAGQTVGINLQDLGIKQPQPSDVVAGMLKHAGWNNVRSTKAGIVASFRSGDAPTTFTGSGEKWTATGGAAKDGQGLLDEIRWKQPGQETPAKTHAGVRVGSIVDMSKPVGVDLSAPKSPPKIEKLSAKPKSEPAKIEKLAKKPLAAERRAANAIPGPADQKGSLADAMSGGQGAKIEKLTAASKPKSPQATAEQAESADSFGARLKTHRQGGLDMDRARYAALAEHLNASGAKTDKSELQRLYPRKHMSEIKDTATSAQIQSHLEKTSEVPASDKSRWQRELAAPKTGRGALSMERQISLAKEARERLLAEASDIDSRAEILRSIGSSKADGLAAMAKKLRADIDGNATQFSEAGRAHKDTKKAIEAKEAAAQQWKPESNTASHLTPKGMADEYAHERWSMSKTLDETGYYTNGKFMLKLPDKLKAQVLEAGGGVKEGRGPDINRVLEQIKSTEREPMRIVGERTIPSFDENGNQIHTQHETIMRDESGNAMILDSKYLRTVQKVYPDVTLHAIPKGQPMTETAVVAKKDGDIVGVIMGRTRGGFTPEDTDYVKSASAVAMKPAPKIERLSAKGPSAEELEAANEATRNEFHAKEAKRIAAMPVKERKNGWEIVGDGANFFVRDPNTKEEIYKGKLNRCREVAGESAPDAPAAPKIEKLTAKATDAAAKFPNPYGDSETGRAYAKVKTEHPTSLVLLRKGDFYELFGDDAREASKLTGLTLTTLDKHGKNPIPMAGFPYHQLDGYMKKLVAAGKRVAIAEQGK